MHARFFVRLNRRRLSVRESGLNAALGKCPTIPAGADKEEFNAGAQDPETDCRDLLPLTIIRKLRRTLDGSHFFETHDTRVHEFISDG